MNKRKYNRWLQSITTRSLILSLLMLTGVYSVGQTKLPTSVFLKHTQLCHYVGTTEKDFVMELFDDSTIKIYEYTSSYRDQYNSILRYTYVGTFAVASDTLKINFLTHKAELMRKPLNGNVIRQTKVSDSFFIYPPNIYIISKETIRSADDILLEAKKTNISIANELDKKFRNWGNRTSSIKEIFGVTKS